MRSIVFCGGGTMGHVMVHLSVYPYLKDFADEFYYIGSKGGVEKNHVQSVFDYREIDAVKFDRSKPFKIFSIPFKLQKAVTQAKDILKKIKPSVVFCGGGYVCVPVAIAAKKLKIPVILHESDLTVGLANKISLLVCEKIITTFPDTLRDNPKAICCGAPVRRELFSGNRREALKTFGLKGEKPVLLVIGGSKGSAALNTAVKNSLDALLNEYEILHICGSDHTTDMAADGYRQFPYITDMAKAYAATDLALSRCGSNGTTCSPNASLAPE
ncbi:MAG: glycosyltransferase, partial [Clostridia bacterium]|nr:glycosyltransferase [Clostridia bacterium]